MIHPSDLSILSLSDPHRTTALVGAKESESDQVVAMTSDVRGKIWARENNGNRIWDPMW